MKETAALCMERANCMMGVASQLALVGTTLMMEPANSSKPPVINYQSTRNHMPEYLNVHEMDDFILLYSGMIQMFGCTISQWGPGFEFCL
jgi:hypothetical protein